ncbi:hypothetical protein GCM10029992_43020 [Glycomyces albus]
MSTGSPVGSHRVVSPAGVLPQAADRLDPTPEIADDEVRVRVERLNLDAASFRQLQEAQGGDGPAVREAVRGIIAERGKMHNPVTGSGGMLIGTVEAVGPRSPLGLRPGQKIATLVSLTLTPLRIDDDLADWDGLTEQIPTTGTAVLFARSIAAVLPDDLPEPVALAVFDVCGAPALVRRVVARRTHATSAVAVLGAAGKSGSLSLAAARDAHAATVLGVVRDNDEADRLERADLADRIAVADATDPSAWPRPSPPPSTAAAPTSPSSASTSPAANTAPSSPPPPAAPSSSSPWPPPSRPPPSAPRAWPPTSRCSSATATSPATPTTRSA